MNQFSNHWYENSPLLSVNLPADVTETLQSCSTETGSPQDSGVDLSTRSTSVLDQTSFFSDQWLHHQADLGQKLHTDLLLVPGVGEVIQLHSAIVLSQSAVLTLILGTSEDQVPTLMLPDVDRDTVLQMVDLLYTGECFISISDFHKLNNLLNSLGFSQLLKSLRCTELENQRLMNHWDVNESSLGTLGDTPDSDEVMFIKAIFGEALEDVCQSLSVVKHVNQNELQEEEISEIKVFIDPGQDGLCSEVLREEKVDNCPRVGDEKPTVVKNVKGGIKTNPVKSSCDSCGIEFRSKNKLKAHKKLQCQNPNGMKMLRSDSKGIKGGVFNHKPEYQSIMEMKSQILITNEQLSEIKPIQPSTFYSSTERRQSLQSTRRTKLKSLRNPKKGRSLPGGLADVAHAVQGGEDEFEAVGGKTAPKPLASRAVVHCRNNIRWMADQEKFDDADVTWVMQQSVRDMLDFQDLTKGEKAFYCAWNKFLLDHRPGVCKIHLRTVLDEFIGSWGKDVREKGLYRQFVAHLVMMEKEGLVGQKTLLEAVQRLQRCLAGENLRN